MSELLATKSVLVVAKKLDDIGLIRSTMSGFAAREVSAASSANMALSMLRAHPFDVVIVDNYLGSAEKSGLQVIEEASREGLRRSVDAYLLIVEKDVTSLPRDSIYCGPDSFLAKPIDPAKLAQRLEKLLKLKQAVYPVESLIDQQDFEKALKFIPLLSKRYPSLELYLERLKGRILLMQEAYDKALAHFTDIAEQRDIDWAHLGVGIALYHQGYLSQAQRVLEQVIERNEKSLEGYEWLARVHRVAGHNEQAQSLLISGCLKLPTAPSLHTCLGNVSSENQSWGTAEEAFRTAVHFAKHSIHQTQDNYFGLARSLQSKLSTGTEPHSAVALEEAVRVLENVVEEYYDDQHIRFRSRLMTAESYKFTGDMQRANAAANDAFRVYQSLEVSDQAQEMENLLEGLEGTDFSEAALAYKNTFNQKVYNETDWGQLNMTGMGHYRKGQFHEAFACFKQSLDIVVNPSILLNMVQAGHELIRQEPSAAQEVLKVCNRYWLDMNIGALNTKQQQRYRSLSERRAALLDSLLD